MSCSQLFPLSDLPSHMEMCARAGVNDETFPPHVLVCTVATLNFHLLLNE